MILPLTFITAEIKIIKRKSNLAQIRLNEKPFERKTCNASMLNQSRDMDLCNYEDNI